VRDRDPEVKYAYLSDSLRMKANWRSCYLKLGNDGMKQFVLLMRLIITEAGRIFERNDDLTLTSGTARLAAGPPHVFGFQLWSLDKEKGEDGDGIA